MLIGFAGKKGSGKTTAAAYIIDRGARSYSLAGPLKLLIKQCYKLSPEQLFGDQKEIVDTRYDKSPRQLMQEIGTDILRAYDPAIWIHCLEDFAKADMTTVIDDVRFPNEVEAILKVGGRVLYIDRPELEATDEHISENAITISMCTDYIPNEDSIQDLHNYVQKVLANG